MSLYSLNVVGPTAEWRWFREVADALAATLEDVGHDVIWNDAHQGIRVLFKPHRVADGGIRLPPGLILYNLEQMADGASYANDAVVEAFRPHEIWDYSPRNIAWWKERGIDARLVPVMGHPVLQRIGRLSDPDIDVLLYGSRCPRRHHVIDALRARGLNAVFLNGVWGKERDAYLARTKVVLNVHHWDEVQRLEVARIVYPMANAIPVVSETGDDSELEGWFQPGLTLVSYDDLVDACERVVRMSKAARDALGAAGQQKVMGNRLVEALKG